MPGGARWTDLLDPSRDELLAALPMQVDAGVVELLAAPTIENREPRPLVEGHGAYVVAVLLWPEPAPREDRFAYLEIDVVVSHDHVVTVRKSSPDGGVADVGALELLPPGSQAGTLLHRLLDDTADRYLEVLDAFYDEINELEDNLETWDGRRIRGRITDLRHDILHARRGVSATRAAVRRIMDGRMDAAGAGIFPRDVELLFGDTYETLVRGAEELDVTRDLLASVQEHHQARIAEGQNEVVKKLTVVASLVLVPALITGWYGQNFEGAFGDALWRPAVSAGLIVGTTLLQLAFYRWRRWI